MPRQIDSIDTKLLYELEVNSRQPLSKLAKKLRMSVQRLAHRQQTLEKNGTIISYIPMIDYDKIGGYTYIVCCLKLHRIGASGLDSALKKCARDPKCTLAFGCEGSYDAMVGTVSNNLFEARETMLRLLAPFEGKIQESLIVVQLSTRHYGRRYLLDAMGKDYSQEGIITTLCDGTAMKGGGEGAIHPLDIGILKAIASNARMPIIEIAEKTGCAPETARNRLRKLEKLGVISKYGLVLNPDKYNHIFFRILISFSTIGPKWEKELTDYLRRFPEIFRHVELFMLNGFFIDIVTTSEERAREIMDDIRDHYPESIQDFKLNTIRKIYKFSYFPGE